MAVGLVELVGLADLGWHSELQDSAMLQLEPPGIYLLDSYTAHPEVAHR